MFLGLKSAILTAEKMKLYLPPDILLMVHKPKLF